MYASDIGRIDGGHCDISGVLLIYHHMNSRGTKVKELQFISILSGKGWVDDLPSLTKANVLNHNMEMRRHDFL